jgi:EAL domain-containing protein (putative c-di-GMP-specific phosphodiesterase class I)
LSGGQVRDDLPAFLSGLMREFGVKSSNIVLEIIETALFDDAEKANEILTALSRLGVRFALDDFGTGFSSLNYVQQFPVSMIKIDRSYTRCLRGTSEADRRIGALVRTCVTLGNELGLPIVAEGIELVEELEGTRALGVELGQGFLFSPPLKVLSFIDLVTAAAGNGAPRSFKLPASLRQIG